MRHVLPHRVGRALEPRGIGQRLLRGKNFHKTMREMIEFIRLRNMPMQRGGIKLREQINALEAGIDAIGNRNINQPILARKRHSRLGPLASERKQPRAAPSAHYHRKDAIGIKRFMLLFSHENTA